MARIFLLYLSLKTFFKNWLILLRLNSLLAAELSDNNLLVIQFVLRLTSLALRL